MVPSFEFHLRSYQLTGHWRVQASGFRSFLSPTPQHLIQRNGSWHQCTKPAAPYALLHRRGGVYSWILELLSFGDNSQCGVRVLYVKGAAQQKTIFIFLVCSARRICIYPLFYTIFYTFCPMYIQKNETVVFFYQFEVYNLILGIFFNIKTRQAINCKEMK